MNPFTVKQIDETLQQAGYILYILNLFEGTVQLLGAIEEVTGFSKEELAKADLGAWTDRIHPEDRAAAYEAQVKLTVSGGTYQALYRIKRKDGKYVKIRDKGFVTPPASGLTPETMGGLITLDHNEQYIRTADESAGN